MAKPNQTPKQPVSEDVADYEHVPVPTPPPVEGEVPEPTVTEGSKPEPLELFAGIRRINY